MTTTPPLAGPPPREVPLRDAPLIRVIGQVRFPEIASVKNQEFIGPFQEALRPTYPALRPEETRSLVMGPGGVAASSGKLWRFFDAERIWQLSLATNFVSLETVKYTDRDDFIARFEAVLEACNDHLDPQIVDRIGVRYVDRLQSEALARVRDFVRPEVAGILNSDLSGDALQAISENLFTLPDGSGQLMARWGLIPSNSTPDPSAIDPIGEPSWVLDVDVFNNEQGSFDVTQLTASIRASTERIYSFFRWAVTDDFLRFYGGDV